MAETDAPDTRQPAGMLVLRTMAMPRDANPLGDTDFASRAALLSALPERATTRRLPSIPGVVPGQYDRPSGCLFSPRCDFATERCVDKAPVTQGQAAGYALCHYPLNQGKPVGHPGPAAILDRRISA